MPAGAAPRAGGGGRGRSAGSARRTASSRPGTGGGGPARRRSPRCRAATTGRRRSRRRRATMKYHAPNRASVSCSATYTIVPTMGPSIEPIPPMSVTKIILADHWTLNTDVAWTLSWLRMSRAPAAPHRRPRRGTRSASPSRHAATDAPRPDLVVPDGGQDEAQPPAEQEIRDRERDHRDRERRPVRPGEARRRIDARDAGQDRPGPAAERREVTDDELHGVGHDPGRDREVPATEAEQQPGQGQRQQTRSRCAANGIARYGCRPHWARHERRRTRRAR